MALPVGMSALLGAAVGAVAGAGIRVLLARLRRGVVLGRGIAETAGAVVTGIGGAVGRGTPTLGLLVLAGLLLVALGAVDIVHHRLPDAITFAALPLAAAAVAVTAVAAPGSGSPLSALLSATALGLSFGAVAHFSPASMGRGDVKLIPTLGLLMGYVSVQAALGGLLIAFVLGSAVSLAGLATRRLRLRSAIPLGPYLLFGCWSVLLLPTLFG